MEEKSQEHDRSTRSSPKLVMQVQNELSKKQMAELGGLGYIYVDYGPTWDWAHAEDNPSAVSHMFVMTPLVREATSTG